MDLLHIDIDRLVLSPANMRFRGKAPDLANILPSVRARGVLVPLIVRPNDVPGHYEIVAGKRRYLAARAVADEGGAPLSLPCAIMASCDDAAALEASLIENIARLDPDEVTRWETFVRLVKSGRGIDDIALTFGLTEIQVKRTLALGSLMPRIRTLYQAGEIDPASVRHLTMASKTRQRDWLTLFDDPDAYAPTGSRLKAWLFGGASIPVSAALFDLATYTGEIVTDLFGEERYFRDSAMFWTAQQTAIAGAVQALRDAGWQEVETLPRGAMFHSWEYERRPKRKGGRVYIAVGEQGEVSVHEGYVTRREAYALAKVEEESVRPARPEVSTPLNEYIDLHRHTTVRAALTGHPGVALRLAVAHLIAGSALWSLRAEPLRSGNKAVTASVAGSPSEGAFARKRRAALEWLGLDPEETSLVHGHMGGLELVQLFRTMLTLHDDNVLDILAVVMGETLDARSEAVDAVGQHLGIDMKSVWTPDDTLLDLIRDREVMNALVAEVAGQSVAQANIGAAVKVQRKIVRDCLSGHHGRTKIENWVPRWMTFPARAYTGRGGVGSVMRAARLADAESEAVADD